MNVHRWRCYFNPLSSDGSTYTGYVDVSDYVDFSNIGTLDQQLDNTDYDIGILS